MGRLLVKWVALALLAVVALAALWTWFTLTYTYSAGDRAGYVQKLSLKGWVCKTWEGELAMVNLPGAMPEIFKFTVRDAAIARRIEADMGKRVRLRYEQHLGIPSSCFGDTEYFIVEASVVE